MLESFREDGEQRALSLVEAANLRENAVRIRWLWLARGALLGSLSSAQQRALSEGHDVELVADRLGIPWLFSYAPVRLDDGRVGAIELGESLGSGNEILRATVVCTVLATVSIAVLAALVTTFLGVRLVGRPVAQLMEKARRARARP